MIIDPWTKQWLVAAVTCLAKHLAVAGLWWFACLVLSLQVPVRFAPRVRMIAMTVVTLVWCADIYPLVVTGQSHKLLAVVGAIFPWWIGTVAGTTIEVRRMKEFGEQEN